MRQGLQIDNPANVRGSPSHEFLAEKARLLARHMGILARIRGSAAEEIFQRTVVIIPALDEEEAIGEVLSTLKSWPFAAIRVVDNGSRDGTGRIALIKGAQVMAEPRRGYGAACWTGMQDLPAEIGWILFCDADGSDDLRSLVPFFEAAAAGCDLVLGNRNALPEGRRALTRVQRFGNAFAGRLIQLVWGTRFHDLGPLRLIRRSSLEAMRMEDRGFGWTVEMQAKAAAARLRVIEIPVAYHPRRAGKSKIAGTFTGSLKAGTIILGTLAKLGFRRAHRHE